MGVAARLSKPVKQSELLDAIVKVLSASSEAKAFRPAHISYRIAKVRQPLRILVAEDNPVNQELVLELLKKRGHKAIAAENGEQALAAARRGGFDAVLMDVQMPKMSGIEATQAIRQVEKVTGDHVPIVAMTAHAMKGDRERCLEAGMDAYVSKPIRAEELFGTVEGLVVAPARGKGSGARKQPGANRLDPSGLPAQAGLAALFGGDTKLLRRVVGIFLDDCPHMVTKIKKAITAQDPEALANAAHGFRGAVNNFGAAEIVEMARELETKGRQGDLNGADEIWRRLERAIPVLAESLRAARSRPPRRSSAQNA